MRKISLFAVAAVLTATGHEPRKLRSSVFSMWKHGSNGMLWSDAQTASPLTLSVPGGSDTVRAGPTPRNWMVPMTEPSP